MPMPSNASLHKTQYSAPFAAVGLAVRMSCGILDSFPETHMEFSMPTHEPPGRRRQSSTEQDRKANARQRVQSFRSNGTRLDLLVSAKSGRDLDRLCKQLATSRRHVVEALIRLASTNPDDAALRAVLTGQAAHDESY